jgi:hypothetical protein
VLPLVSDLGAVPLLQKLPQELSFEFECFVVLCARFADQSHEVLVGNLGFYLLDKVAVLFVLL